MSRASAGTAALKTAAVLLAAAAVLYSCSFWRGAKTGPTSGTSPAAPLPSQPGTAAGMPPGPQDARPEVAGPETKEEAPAAEAPAGPGITGPKTGGPAEPAPGADHEPGAVESGAQAPPSPAESGAAPGAAPGATAEKARSSEGGAKPHANGGEAGARAAEPGGGAGRPGHVVVARLPEGRTFDNDGPYWAREREELAYRVEFLGITMGYARFVFQGKVLLDGREAYHLSVRAWTSSVLALIYPVNETIDYYMDPRTLEPLRQEYSSGGRKKDDVATYDQGTGKIVYRYKESGEVRKQVDAVPNVYDPVTLAYFFRSREPGADEKGRNVYAGRKVWEISASSLGTEKIATDRGDVDTIVIRPVIKRDGKVEDKGDLRMWMTRDVRRVPVRIYAKFKKIRTWTLVGELMPERKGG